MSKKPIELHPSWQKKAREERENKRFTIVQKGWGKGFVSKATLVKQMFHPHFWGAWFCIFLLWLTVTILPYPVIMFLGRKLGHILGKISPSRKYVLNRNLELAFPDMSKEDREKLSLKVQENSGQALFETGMAWFWSDRRLLKHACIDENQRKKALEIAASNRPILVLTAHFVHLEIMARLYALYVTPGIGVYKPTDHPVWEWAQVHGRLRDNIALVDRRDPRSMIKALMRNLPIWYAPDQDYGPKASVFVPFFGVEKTATVVGTHNLARVKNTQVQASWTIRKNGKYQLFIDDPLDNFPTDDEVLDTIRINKVIEKMILMAPEQYLWLHRRFKTTPEGESSRYPLIKH